MRTRKKTNNKYKKNSKAASLAYCSESHAYA